MQTPVPSAVAAQKQLLPLPHVFHAPQDEAAQPGISGMAGGATQVPALQDSPDTQVLPHEPQLEVSVCRSLQVSGVLPQREEAEPEHGHDVAVTRTSSVTVELGVRVRVVAGTVMEIVSVSSVIVVMSMASVVYAASVKVVVEVKSSVAEGSSRHSQAAERVSQEKPVRRAVGAVSQDGSGVGTGVMAGVVESTDVVGMV